MNPLKQGLITLWNARKWLLVLIAICAHIYMVFHYKWVYPYLLAWTTCSILLLKQFRDKPNFLQENKPKWAK